MGLIFGMLIGFYIWGCLYSGGRGLIYGAYLRDIYGGRINGILRYLLVLPGLTKDCSFSLILCLKLKVAVKSVTLIVINVLIFKILLFFSKMREQI